MTGRIFEALLLLLTLLLLGTVGAFLFYVPIVSAFAAVVVLASLILMFSFGFYARSLWSSDDHEHKAR